MAVVVAVNPWTLAVGPASGGPEQEFTGWRSWRWSRSIDDGCTVTVETTGRDAAVAMIDELATDLWVLRGSNVEQRFRIVAVDQEWGESAEDEVTVTAACYRRMLGARHVLSPLTFTGVSQGLIAWGLIDHTQSQVGGDLGITLGSPGPVVPRDRTYDVGQNILDAIRNLSQVIGGLSWRIDETLALYVSDWASFPTHPQPIVLGATASRLRRPSGSAAFANVGIALGNVEATSPAIAETSDLASDPRGRWERVVSHPSVVIQDTLDEHAAGLVERAVSPEVGWMIDVPIERFLTDADYATGDRVTIVQPASVVAPFAPVPVTVDAQVVTIEVDCDGDGRVAVSLTAVST